MQKSLFPWLAAPSARSLPCLAVVLASLGSPDAWAGKAHVHGLVNVNVAVEGATLTLQVEAPLDSLVGFEHRPRTDAQRQAAQAAVKQMNDAASWAKPDAAARCTLSKTEVNAEALEPAKPGVKDNAHADLDATVTFTCKAPEKLAAMELGLFDAFKRIERITVQVATTKGQSKQTLRRPARSVALTR